MSRGEETGNLKEADDKVGGARIEAGNGTQGGDAGQPEGEAVVCKCLAEK